MISIDPNDTRTCPVCREIVPLRSACSCELVRANHLAVVLDTRRTCGILEARSYRSADEQGMAESDQQDAPEASPLPQPLIRLTWPQTISLLLALALLSAMFVHATEGVARTGQSELRTWRAEQSDIDRQITINGTAGR